MSSNQLSDSGPTALLEGHMPLAGQIASRMKRRYNWVPLEDLYSYALLGLTKAANAFDPDRRVPFRNYASEKAMFWAIDEMRKDGILRRSSAKALPKTISFGQGSDRDEQRGDIEMPCADADRAHHRLEARDLIAAMFRQLREKERHLLSMYYADEMTFREIAEVLGVSESSVCLKHKAVIGRLRQYVSAQGLA